MKKFILVLGIMFCMVGMASTAFAVTLSYDVTTDNELTMYISEDPTINGTYINEHKVWTSALSGSYEITSNKLLYLHIFGWNYGGPGGFIGDFTLSDTSYSFANGTQYLTSNTTDWTVAANGWQGTNEITSVGTRDYDSNGWYYLYGGNKWPSIDANASWIWVSDNYGSTAYITTVLTPNAPPPSGVPEPASLILMVMGLMGLVSLRKRIR